MTTHLTGTVAAQKHLVLCVGQSNCTGQAATSGITGTIPNPHSTVKLYEDDQASSGGWVALRAYRSLYGPEMTLGQTLGVKFPNLHILKAGHDGSPISSWLPSGGSYDTLRNIIATARAGLTGVVRCIGIVWVQGETDGGDVTLAPLYGDKLVQVAGVLRGWLGTDAPFVVARLSSGQTTVTQLATLRAQQAYGIARIRNSVLVNTDSLASDGLHYGNAGQEGLGTLLANALPIPP